MAPTFSFVSFSIRPWIWRRPSNTSLAPGIVAELNFATEIEPLHDLIHVHAVQVRVVGLRNCGANQLAAYVIGALHLAFVFEFELAGDGGQRGVDVADARDDYVLLMRERAALGVGDHVFHRGDGQTLAYAGTLVDFLVFARDEGDALDDFLHIVRELQTRTVAASPPSPLDTIHASCAVMAIPSSTVAG